MNPWWSGIAEDFSDIPEPAQIIRVVMRLLVAALLGGLLGYQREVEGKAAGLRTHMLVSLGAAIFTMVPEQTGMPLNDLSRVIQGVVTGIGFIGAGAILKQTDKQQILGLTTAAGLWLTAGIGMAAGMGRETFAITGALFALIILWLLPHGNPNGQQENSGNQKS